MFYLSINSRYNIYFSKNFMILKLHLIIEIHTDGLFQTNLSQIPNSQDD